MNDFYTEQLIKRKTLPSTILAKAGLIVLTVLSVFLVFLIPFAIIVPVVLIALDVLMFKRMNVEYEYLYINGDLDIDKIMSKEKRKRMFSMNINDMDIIAPVGAPELNSYRNIKTFDYTTHEDGHRCYEMVVTENGSQVKVVFEPNEAILEGMKMMAPRKVIVQS